MSRCWTGGWRSREEAAQIRCELVRKGQPIGHYDTLIAAHARSLNATLITHNTREFGRVDGLQTEDWESVMSTIGKPERVTQNRVIALFRDELGYRYLGDWSDRPGNSNIEEELLTEYLTRCGYSPEQISRAIYLLTPRPRTPTAASTTTTRRSTACCATACR